jgi:beta-glucosidase-like glycosyl hydrolase
MKNIDLKPLFSIFAKAMIALYVLLIVGSLALSYLKRYAAIEKQDLVTPVILNVRGETLTDLERKFFVKANPFGFILAKHNFHTFDQVKSLIVELRSLFPNRKIYVSVDQEGGRVDRLQIIAHHKEKLLKSAKYYGDMARVDLLKAKSIIYKDSRYTANILNDMGFDINYAPMLDLLHDNVNNISLEDETWAATQHRSYSLDHKITVELGLEFIRGMHDEGIFAATKHQPGIGRSFSDSHDQSVFIDTSLKLLEKTDFIPFRDLASATDFAMVGHATYRDIDKDNPATVSKKVIDIIRGEKIGFKGLLISDALNMKALDHLTYEQRVRKSYEAGMDIIIPNYISLDTAGLTINNMDHNVIIAFNKRLKIFEKNNKLTK